MDWSFIGEHLPLYAEAAKITLTISFFGVVFSLIVGLISAQISLSKIPVLSQLNALYVELSRGTPLLIQLFLIYFGLTKVGLKMDAEVAAVVGLTFLGGSYMAEVFRAGFESVAAIQFESAQVLGLSKIQALQHVILPQARCFRHCPCRFDVRNQGYYWNAVRHYRSPLYAGNCLCDYPCSYFFAWQLAREEA